MTHARATATKADTKTAAANSKALEAANSAVLPDANWVENFDANSGMHYYWHKVTNETVWEKPASFAGTKA